MITVTSNRISFTRRARTSSGGVRSRSFLFPRGRDRCLRTWDVYYGGCAHATRRRCICTRHACHHSCRGSCVRQLADLTNLFRGGSDGLVLWRVGCNDLDSAGGTPVPLQRACADPPKLDAISESQTAAKARSIAGVETNRARERPARRRRSWRVPEPHLAGCCQ
jgi:hypothetical protein